MWCKNKSALLAFHVLNKSWGIFLTGTTFVNTFHLIYSRNTLPIIYSKCVEMHTSQGFVHFVHPLGYTFVLFFSIRQRDRNGSLFTADVSRWLQKPLNVATVTAVQGHSSNDGGKEKVGKMRRTGGDANLLRKGAQELMKHFLDDYPQVHLVLGGHRTSLRSPPWEVISCLFSAALNFQKRRVCTLWLYTKCQIEIIYTHWLRTKKSLYMVSVRSKKNLQPTLITSIWTTLSGSLISLRWHFLLQSHNTNTPRGCAPACTDAPMSTRQRRGSSHAVYSLSTSQGRGPLSGLTSAVCPTFLPSNMPPSYGAPADAP